MQSVISPVISTTLYFVVFGAAIGSRISEVDGVSYGAFIVPGLIMLSLMTPEPVECGLRDLFPEIHRHDLRDPVRARVLFRNNRRLCGRGGDKGGVCRLDHFRDRDVLRADRGATSRLDGHVLPADRHDLRSARLHHRDLGRYVREAAVRTASDRDAARLSRRAVFTPSACCRKSGRR